MCLMCIELVHAGLQLHPDNSSVLASLKKRQGALICISLIFINHHTTFQVNNCKNDIYFTLYTKSFVSHFDSTVVLSVVEPNSVFNQLSEQCLIACRKRVSCSSCPTTSWQPSRSRTHPCRALQAKFALGSLKCLFSACCEGLSWSSSSRKNHTRTLWSILAKCLPRRSALLPCIRKTDLVANGLLC